jgi:hypothetical protein
VSATAYISLLSVHYIGDGIRWLHPITDSVAPPGGGVSHLGYPALQWTWNRLVAGVGSQHHDFATIIVRLQAFNALTGAAGLALFYTLLVRWRTRWTAALLATLGLAGSYAFAVHATDMTEVMPSFPLAVVALLLAFRPRAGSSRIVAAVAAALFLSLAGAVYLNAFLLAPAVAVGLVDSDFLSSGGRLGPRLRAVAKNPRLWVFGLVLLGCAAGILAVSRLSHDPVLADPTGQGAYGHLTVGHVLGLAFGLANAAFGLVGFDGGSRFLRGGLHGPQIYNFFAVGAALLLVVLVAAWTYGAWRSNPDWRQPLVAIGLWLLVPLGFAAYWDNTYTKLWLAPLAAWWALIALGISSRPGLGRWMPALTMMIAVVTADLVLHVAPNHFQPDSAVIEATVLATRAGPNDLVVATGYETVGADYEALMRKPFLSYVATAYHHPGDPVGLDRAVDERICQVQQNGGTVYVVALLDISRGQWSPFLGDRLHLNFDHLQGLREQSTRIQLQRRGDAEPVRIINATWSC